MLEAHNILRQRLLQLLFQLLRRQTGPSSPLRESPETVTPLSLSDPPICRAQVADIPALCELLSDLFSQEAEFVPDREAQSRGLSRILADESLGTVWVFKDERHIVGMVSVLYTVSTALGAEVALLEDMVVAPSHRGRQIGARLLAHAIADARRRGCLRITLLTDADNARAQAFYARQGFVRSGMVPLRLDLRRS